MAVCRYAEMLNKDIMPEGYLEAPLAYDAVWATALGRTTGYCQYRVTGYSLCITAGIG